MPPEIKFESPAGELTLCRYPAHPDEKLRAWDAADEYILSYINELDTSDAENLKRILVVNDGFGALALGIKSIASFADAEITVVSDSVISHLAIKANADTNKIDLANVQLESSFSFTGLASELDQPYDLVIVKVSKSLAQLEENLQRIRASVSESSRIIGAGMVKNVHNSTLALFETCIGPTKSSLAKKKARLIFSEVDAKTSDVKPESAKKFTIGTKISQAADDLVLASYPGVFCHGSLDYGTQFLLETLQLFDPTTENEKLNILDLGCGTGALGITAAKRFSNSEVTFVDESFAAIESVKESLRLTSLDHLADQYQCIVTHCLEGIADNSQDLILNNPPFHDAAARTSSIAMEMFQESERVLRIGGQLQVVANKHLGYRPRLKEIFGNCKETQDNGKFVVLSCIKKETLRAVKP